MTTAWLPALWHIQRGKLYLLILPGSLPDYEIWTLTTHEHPQHISHVIYSCTVAEHIKRGKKRKEYFTLSLLLALLLSQSQLSNSLPLAALSVPDLRPFPQHRNSMLALAARIRNRGKLGTSSDSSEVVRILSLQLHSSQEQIKVLSSLCAWHHWLISYYKIKSYLKISATVKASPPLPVLNWDFKSGTVYTGYFSWHAY